MWVKILLLIFVASFLIRSDFSLDQDLGRHIKLGEIIWQTKQIPTTNLFSYTNPDFKYINSHWLFGVMAYLFQQAGALNILLYLKVVVILLAVWLILSTIPKTSYPLLLPIGFISLHVLRERTELRPEIFSFLFTSLTLFILTKYLKGPTKWICILPLIQLVWVNTHIYFLIGLILQAIFLTYIGYQHLRFNLSGGKLKLLSIIFVLSVLTSLINPHGISGFLYPLTVTQNYGYTIVENQTMSLLESIGFVDRNFLFVRLSVGLVGLSILVGFLRKNLTLKNILLSLLGVTLALLHVRSFPYLVLISLPAALENFGVIKQPKLTTILATITGLLLIIESYLYLNGSYYKSTNSHYQPTLKFEQSIKGGLDFVLSKDLPNPIYNNFDIGSYIIYRGYPKYKVFVDGRPEAYPKDFFQTVYILSQSDYNKFKELDNSINFQTVIFSHTDQTPWGRNFLQNIVKDENWKLVYFDDFVIVFVEEELASQNNLPTIQLSQISSSSYKFDNHVAYLRMGLFLNSVGYAEQAQQFFQKAGPIIETRTNFFW